MTLKMILLLSVVLGLRLQEVIYFYLLALDTVYFLTAALPEMKRVCVAYAAVFI